MTQVITRYFDSAAQAQAVKDELVRHHGLSRTIVNVYNSADGLADALSGADVDPDTAKAYEKRVSDRGAVLMVRAGYKPLGVARITREVTADMGAIALPDATEEVYVKEDQRLSLSVLADHPLMLTRRHDPNSTKYHMADWPIRLISRRKPMDAFAFPRHARMAKFPVPLILRRTPYTGSIFPRHARMANFPIPLISRRKPFDRFAFPRHARMANFPIPLISRRKPFDRFAFPRHARMATWPFPLLINGETGQNALIPGQPYMANFPIRLISKREPFDGSIIPRHARMAKFPIPLISRRKPYSGFAFSRHARMANFPLPLVIRRSETAAADGGQGFSLSKLLRLPTLIRR